MERVARTFGCIYYRSKLNYPLTHPFVYTSKHTEDTVNIGDIAKMLKLPDRIRSCFRRSASHAACCSETLHRSSIGNPCRHSEILFLGRQFQQHLFACRHGSGAIPLVSLNTSVRHLHRPIDKIVINAGGTDATRQALVQEISRGNDRLAGKRVLIYQFATRELFSGAWKLLSIPSDSSTPERS